MSARGISINNIEGDVNNEQRINRPEMRGPTFSNSSKQQTIGNILSGLKTKQIDIDNKDGSTISVEELKELSDTTKITKSKRKQKSDKNTVSLDI